MSDATTQTVTELAKRLDGQLFGKYRGTVYDNNDPLKRGRLKLLVPSVFGDQPTDWIGGAFPLASAAREAFIVVPETNSHVLVEFVEGDKSAPIWTAAYFPDTPQQVEVPADFDLEQGQLHLLRTRMGLALRLEDDGEAVQVLVISHPGGGEIRVDQDGITTIKDQAGAMVQLDPKAKVTKVKGHGDQGGLLNMTEDKTTLGHGSVQVQLSASGIESSAPQISLKSSSVLVGDGAGSPILDAQAFANIFDAHTHATAGGIGAPSPPVPLLAPALLGVSLKKVKGA